MRKIKYLNYPRMQNTKTNFKPFNLDAKSFKENYHSTLTKYPRKVRCNDNVTCKKNKENAHIEFKDIALELGLGLG